MIAIGWSLLNKNVEISENYKNEYVMNVVNFLGNYFTISLDSETDIPGADLYIFRYFIDGYKVSFIIDYMDGGTSMQGRRVIINKILELVKREKPELFDLLK